MTPDNAPPPYRMTVTTSLSFQDAVSLVDRLLADWLKEEGYDEPPPADPDRPPERLRLGDRVLLDRDGGKPRVGGPEAVYGRRRLRTPAPHGTHQLLVTTASAGGEQPVRLRIEADQLPAGSGIRPGSRGQVPELVRTLLPLLDAADGPSALTPMPAVVRPNGVDELIDELCDPERRLPMVIASVPPAERLEVWFADAVHPVMRQLSGLASLHVLDHAALPLFNVALEYHKVYGGAVRTYLPEVDPASRGDSTRHPVLPRHRIDEDVRRAAGLLAREPRRIAAELPLPEILAAVPAFELPPEARVPVARCASAAEPGSAELHGTRNAPVFSGGAVPGQGFAPVTEFADRGQQPVAADLQSLRRGLLGVRRRELHLPLESDAIHQVGGKFRLLTGRLRPAAGPEQTAGLAESAAEVLAADDDAPTSFGELVGRFDEFPLLQFTGDEKETLALDGQCDGIGWARLTWDGLTALQEYANAAVRGQAGGDFKQWCEHTPPGCHRFPPRKAVRGESRAVASHGKWKRQRMLPVPACVEPTRRAFMGAHLRIGGGGTAPRVHYLDDCSGSGRIYVGYIGLHLTNTRTN